MADKRDIQQAGSEAAQSKTRTRAQFACKPELRHFLYAVNLIPADFEMKSVRDLPGMAFNISRPGSSHWTEAEEKGKAAFDEYLKSFPLPFQAIINSSSNEERKRATLEFERTADKVPDEETVLAIRGKIIAIYHKERQVFENLRTARANLFRLAEIGEHVDQYRGKRLDVALSVLLVEYARLDEQGIIHRESYGFARAIEGVDVSRIRACSVCKKLFWAARKDMKCCSSEHSAVIRQRQSRQNKKEKGAIYAKFSKAKRNKADETKTKRADKARKR